jgi:hypothetical protein
MKFSKEMLVKAIKLLSIDKPCSMQELKLIFRRLCSIHHPDKGGKTKDMQDINWAYKYAIKNFEHIENCFSSDNSTTKYELSEEGKQILDKLLILPNINIDIVGCWLWVSGDTKPIKDELKTIGLNWHAKKSMWVYAGSKANSRGTKDYDAICETYGKIRKSSQKATQIK